MTPEELSERWLELAARVGNVVDALPETRMGRHVAGQLVRCGTSPGPNYEEACAGESRADFIYKMKIALKEMRETRHWLSDRQNETPTGKEDDWADRPKQSAL